MVFLDQVDMHRQQQRSSIVLPPLVHLISLALLLPVLLLGRALGDSSAWVHAHGSSGWHAHVLQGPAAEGGRAALEPWHATLHDHDGEPHHHDKDRPPTGIVVDVPLFAATGVPVVGARHTLELGLSAFALFAGDWTHATHRPESFRSHWPPGRLASSGIVALLRSSHAILI